MIWTDQSKLFKTLGRRALYAVSDSTGAFAGVRMDAAARGSDRVIFFVTQPVWNEDMDGINIYDSTLDPIGGTEVLMLTEVVDLRGTRQGYDDGFA